MKSYYSPTVFERFPKLSAGLSLRDTKAPGELSVLSTNCTEDVAATNRTIFTEVLGFKADQLALAHLQHGDDIGVVDESFVFGSWPKVDALITTGPGHLLAVTLADCVGVLLYDPKTSVIAAIHSGWRGSLKNIAGKTVAKLTDEFGVSPAGLYAYVGPAPFKDEYETSAEIAGHFDPKYSSESKAGHSWFDNQAVVVDQLIAAGVVKDQMEIDDRSTISDPQLHSHRRDAKKAGRMIAAIGKE